MNRPQQPPERRGLGFGRRLRGLFARESRDDEAAEREEYRRPERGLEELEHDPHTRPHVDGAEVAEADLDDFRPPRDAAP